MNKQKPRDNKMYNLSEVHNLREEDLYKKNILRVPVFDS